jgi:uncharacterized protein YjbI with pentapeptide repeats
VAEFVCGVEEKNPNYLSVCKNLPEYRDTGYCVLHFPGEEKKEAFEQVKQSKLEQEDYDFSGTVFPEGTADFSKFVFDGNADFAGATFVGQAHFQDAQFSGETTVFAEAKFSSETTDFAGAEFSGETTVFSSAEFSGESTVFFVAEFSGQSTSFSSAEFSGETMFLGAKFSGVRTDFAGAKFSGRLATFSSAEFSGVRTVFKEAEFSAAGTVFKVTEFSAAETSFRMATFLKEVDFTAVTFREKVDFWGDRRNLVFGSEAWAWFDSVRIEKPELLTFNNVLLHPGWFINTDVRKVGFTDVKWYGMPGGPEGTLDEEIAFLEDLGIESSHTLLGQACRRLSANAEENREYPLANEFHYWSMDALRKGVWRFLKDLTWRDFLKADRWSAIVKHFGLITTLYWALSGYGVRATRAFLVLVGICAAFAALYMVFGPPKLEDLGQALVYSLGAVARLNPEPRPTEPGVFQFLVIVEGLLGPLQIALLALAIRRKVMR